MTDGDPPDTSENAAPYTLDTAVEEVFMSRESLQHILEQLRRKKNIIHHLGVVESPIREASKK